MCFSSRNINFFVMSVFRESEAVSAGQISQMFKLKQPCILIWAPKLGAQIKGEMRQSNISHSIKSSTEMHLHIFRHLT